MIWMRVYLIIWTKLVILNMDGYVGFYLCEWVWTEHCIDGLTCYLLTCFVIDMETLFQTFWDAPVCFWPGLLVRV